MYFFLEEAQALEQIHKVMFDFPMTGIQKECTGGSAKMSQHESTEANFCGEMLTIPGTSPIGYL